jgi:general nucleoside transport system permease protein
VWAIPLLSFRNFLLRPLLGDIHTFTEGMTRGSGYLAIAAVIFGKWKILNTTLACLLFGAATALQFQLPAMGIAVPMPC